MEKKIEYILIALFFASCGLKRDVNRDKSQILTKEKTETKITRLGDTVRYEIPKYIFKDTTIVKKNYVSGTTQIVRFDKKGMVEQAECISGLIDIVKKQEKNVDELINTKKSQKDFSISPLNMLIIMGGFCIITIICTFVIVNKFK